MKRAWRISTPKAQAQVAEAKKAIRDVDNLAFYGLRLLDNLVDELGGSKDPATVDAVGTLRRIREDLIQATDHLTQAAARTLILEEDVPLRLVRLAEKKEGA